MFSKRTLEGEILSDNRASGGVKFEAPTITCSHCQAIVIVNPARTRPRPFCFQCDRYICDTCNLARTSTGYTHQSFAEFADLYLNAAAKGTP